MISVTSNLAKGEKYCKSVCDERENISNTVKNTYPKLLEMYCMLVIYKQTLNKKDMLVVLHDKLSQIKIYEVSNNKKNLNYTNDKTP